MWGYRMCRVYLMLSYFLILVHCATSSIICKDNEDQPVDWFIIYKLPTDFNHSTFSTTKKRSFPPHLYMDSNQPTYKSSKTTLNDTTGALPFTLSQVYKNHKSAEVGYILYNDEKPYSAGGKTSESHGHTKGVVAFDKTSGFWVVHSAPRFPPPTNTTYSYPKNAVKYGQHILCVSLGAQSQVVNVGTQLKHNKPFVYDYNLPSSLSASYPVMKDVIDEIWSKDTHSKLSLETPNGLKFLSFAKSPHFDADLYADLVAVSLQCDMLTETWQHSSASKNLPSNCTNKYHVQNVLRIEDKSLLNMNFSNYADHSKFAVCSTYWTCVGDINRQKSQMYRGGGTVCLNNPAVNKQYHALINEWDKCPTH